MASNLTPYFSPEENRYLPFIGLIFPWLIISNGIFFIYWLFRRKKQFLWSLICVLASYYSTSRFIQLTFSQPDEANNEIHVMSYNVRLFDLYNWGENEVRRDKIMTFIQQENPDVICFQEYFYSSGNHFNTRDTLLELVPFVDYFEHFTTKVQEKPYQGGVSHFGSAIFSKYPIINREVIEFENDKTNNCILIDIVKGDDTVRIYNAHVGSIRLQKEDYSFLANEAESPNKKEQQILRRLSRGYKKRAVQLKKVLNDIDLSPYPTILCTDMNDTPVSHAYHMVEQKLSDAFTISGNGIGSSYIGSIPFLRIDYIWHTENLKSRNFKTHSESNSDHRAISCIIGN